MVKDFLNYCSEGNSVKEFADCIRHGIPVAAFGVTDAFKGYLLSQTDKKVVFITSDMVSADKITARLKTVTDKKVVFIPENDDIFIKNKAFSKDNLFKHIRAVGDAFSADIVILTAQSSMQYFPKHISSFSFEKGKEYERETYLDFLVSSGYVKADRPYAKGQFSLRGDVLEIFPTDEDCFYRISFFGDEVEVIKKIDPETDKSFDRAKKIIVPSAVSSDVSEDDLLKIDSLIKEEYKRAKRENNQKLLTLCEDAFKDIESKNLSALSTLNVFSENKTDIFSLFDKGAVFIVDEPKKVQEIAELSAKEFKGRFSSFLTAGETFSFLENARISFDNYLFSLKNRTVAVFQNINSATAFFSPLKIINPSLGNVQDYRLNLKELETDVKNRLKEGYKVAVCCGDKQRFDDVSVYFSKEKIPFVSGGEKQGAVSVYENGIDYGFVYHETKVFIVGAVNLYKRQVARKPLRKKQTFFTAPTTGDFAVHEVYGVGRVLGNKKISTTESTKDYIAVEYAGGDVLYVPVDQMDILTRYVGGEKQPRLNKIGGYDFARIKNRVKESVKKMSFDLKRLYEERNRKNGYRFIIDDEIEKTFENAFPYEDTPDQVTATADVKKDMASSAVMDRLICGDVGFGKTEIAFRAVFIAVMNGKQAAMLAPTTILTEQHFNTAVKRFEGFGIKIACLNRFKSKKEQKIILEKLKNGEIDFIIGTHRLLSADVGFKDLGLLVLDEEQRFGVEHKEKIKLLKNNVDTLTLSATPIPRTLHMSLSGIRSISCIDTPPKNRIPVQTYVTEETNTLIKDAVEREVGRGGQVFILYNRIENIFSFAEKIEGLLKDVKMTVIHGRMEENTLENNVMAFYHGEYDVLLSTTIIENGIDLPRANTIIVIDADRLGLSTLYQLKGRVGRSDMMAYAFFTYKKDKILSEQAYQRLNAIIEFAEMGSGIKIAMRDLEIRGAGNVLGAEQHGHMDKIGYELYSKILKEELSGKEEIITEMDVDVSAYIPEDYIFGNQARMDAYKEIAEIRSKEDEKALRSEFEATYGTLPQEVDNLICVASVKHMVAAIKGEKVRINNGVAEIIFGDIKSFDNDGLLDAVRQNEGVNISVSGKPALHFATEGKSNSDLLTDMKIFLEEIIK